MARHVPGTVPGDAVRRSKTDLAWLPDRLRETGEYLAAIKLEEDSGMQGELGLQECSRET